MVLYDTLRPFDEIIGTLWENSLFAFLPPAPYTVNISTERGSFHGKFKADQQGRRRQGVFHFAR
jgi:hypothetical protein